MPLLEFNHVSFINDGKTILNNLSISVEKKDFVSIIGPSGSGKSTLLKLCGHIISPTSGMILYQNKSVFDYNPTELRKHISYCFQTPYLFGNTVQDNINFVYQIRNLKVEESRIHELFTLFSMSGEYLDKEVVNLSGGEKQRIALIRSLLFLPDVLLLDEITSALDTMNTEIVEKVIKSLNQSGVTILWVTHNMEQSRKYANKILTVEAGEIKSLEVIR